MKRIQVTLVFDENMQQNGGIQQMFKELDMDSNHPEIYVISVTTCPEHKNSVWTLCSTKNKEADMQCLIEGLRKVLANTTFDAIGGNPKVDATQDPSSIKH